MADAAIRSATTEPVPAALERKLRAPVIPGAEDQVSILLNRDVLKRFQEDGTSCQSCINALLRKALWI